MVLILENQDSLCMAILFKKKSKVKAAHREQQNYYLNNKLASIEYESLQSPLSWFLILK